MNPPHRAVDYHVGKITKKYIIDFLNALLFSNTVLWDGDDQFNELPIFSSSNEEGYRVEQRGALFVNQRTATAIRLSVIATESTVQRVCYRMKGLDEPLRIDEGKIYYPLGGGIIDISAADLNLGKRDSSSYSFSDNTNNTGKINNSRLFTILRFLTKAICITMDDKAIFTEILDDQLSLPPVPSDPHYKPVFGVQDADAINSGD
jgi:hypothetical protein